MNKKKQIADEMLAQGFTLREIGIELGCTASNVWRIATDSSNGRRTRSIRKFLSIYSWMQEYISEHGYAPAIKELVDAGFSSSTSVIRYYLCNMQKLGMIERRPGIPRGMRLLPLSQTDPMVRKIIVTIQPNENSNKLLSKQRINKK